jgi:hypothetical protein
MSGERWSSLGESGEEMVWMEPGEPKIRVSVWRR